MAKCVNINNPEFTELVQISGITPLKLSAMMGTWMEENNTDEWPTLEQLGIINFSQVTKIKPGVPDVFESNPELVNIGTQEQYSAYLNTIFPDSKMKDIVYHGTVYNILNKKFDISRAGSSTLGFAKAAFFTNNKKWAWERFAFNDRMLDGTEEGNFLFYVLLDVKTPTYHNTVFDFNKSVEEGFIENLHQDLNAEIISLVPLSRFSANGDATTKQNQALINYDRNTYGYNINYISGTEKEIKIIKLFGKELKQEIPKKISKEEFEASLTPEGKKIYTNSINKINSYFSSKKNDISKAKKLEKSSTRTPGINKGSDSVISKQTDNTTFEYAVFEPEQIHILGGKQDIEGFKEFVQGKQSVTPRQGIAELFIENPQLASIGTQEQYERYLSTIFPDSKVKDIVYHGSNQKIEQFEIKKEPLIHFGTKSAALQRGNILHQILLNIRDLQTIKDGMWFLGTQEGGLLRELLDRNILTIEEVRSIIEVKNKTIENSYSDHYGARIAEGEKKGNEKLQEILKDRNIGFEYINLSEDKGSISYAVPSQKQIHILGSKQDIDGFKQYLTFSKVYPKKIDPEFDMDWINEKMSQINEYGVYTGKDGRRTQTDMSNNPYVWDIERRYDLVKWEGNNKKYKKFKLKKAIEVASEMREQLKMYPIKIRYATVTTSEAIIRVEYTPWDRELYYYQKGINTKAIDNDLQEVAEVTRMIDESITAEINEVNTLLSTIKKGDVSNSQILDMLTQLENYDPNLTPLINLLKNHLRLIPRVKVKVSDSIQNTDLFGNFAIFDGTTGTIWINELAFQKGQFINSNQLVTSILHEFIHAFSVNELKDTNSDFYKTINRLYKVAKMHTKYGNKQAYKSVEEFLSESLTNPVIMDELKKMPLNIWQRIKRLIGKIFGIDLDVDTVYNKIFNQTVDYIEKVMSPIVYDGKFARKIEEEFFLEKENPTHMDIYKTFLNIEKRVEVVESSHQYFLLDEKGNRVKELTGLTGTIGSMGWGFKDKDNDFLKKSAAIRSTIHYTIEMNTRDLSEQVARELEIPITDDARKQIQRILNRFKTKGATILTEVLVVDIEKGLASKVDMIILDANGDIHIYYFGTKQFKSGFNKWTSPNLFRVNKKTDREYATLQLSVYKDMVEKIVGKKVKSINVVMLQADVEKDDITDKEQIINVRLSTAISPTGVDTVMYTSDTKYVYRYLRKNQGIEYSIEDKFSEELLSEMETRIETDLARFSNEMDFVDKRAFVFQEMLRDLLVRRKNLYKRGKRAEIENLDELIKNITEEENVEQKIILLLKHVEKETKRIFKERSEYKKEGKIIPLNILTGWYYFVSAYDKVNSLRELLNAEYDFDKKIGPKYRSLLDTVIENKENIKGLYVTEGKSQIIDFLAPHYNMFYVEFRDRMRKKYRYEKALGKNHNMSEEEFIDKAVNENESNLRERTRNTISRELDRASSDIHVLKRWIDNVLDSSDAVVSALVKAFVIKDEEARISNLAIRDEFLSVAREFEMFNKKYGLRYKSLYDSYKFMLELDDQGNPTGHILTKFKSLLFKEILKQRKIAIETSKTPEDAEAAFKDWINGNAPLDRQAFGNALDEFFLELSRKEIINAKELERLQDNSGPDLKIRYKYSEMVSDGKLNEIAGDEIINWIATNTWNYREPIEKWQNKEWKDLKKILENQDDPRTKVYNLITNYALRSDIVKGLPFTFRLNTRLPGVVKNSDERFREGQSLLSIFKNSLRDEFTFKVDDTHKQHFVVADNGEVKYFLPIHYTGMVSTEEDVIDPQTGKPKLDKDGNVVKKRIFDPSRQSFDLLGIYYKYITMANDYNHKNQILPEMELTRHFINTRKSGQIPIWNRLFNNTKINKGEDKPKNDKLIANTQLAQQINDWFIQVVYKQQEDSNAAEGAFDWAKVWNVINKYTSLNLLGMNFVQGTANVILGETLQRIETFAGEYMSPKNFMKADKLYAKNLNGIVGDIGARNPNNVVSLLLQQFGVLDDYGSTDFDRESKVGQLMRLDTLYFTSRMGEHYMQTRFLLGLLDTVDAYDDTGTRIGSMLDMYKVEDGKLVLDKRVNTNLSKWNESDLFNFKYKTRGILSRLHGEYSELGRVAIQRMAIGRMVYMFRKFVVPGFRRRWGKKEYIERLGQFVEGNYVTTGKFVGAIGGKIFGKTEENSALDFWPRLLNNLHHFKFAMMSAEWESLTDHEKANIRRTLSEVAFLIAALIMIRIAGKQLEDDDEDEWFWSFISYQALRFKAELLFFSPKLDEAMSILRSPMASMSVAENIIELISQLFDLFEVYERGPWKGRLKISKKIMDMTPVRRQFYRLKNIGEQAKWFQK